MRIFIWKRKCSLRFWENKKLELSLCFNEMNLFLKDILSCIFLCPHSDRGLGWTDECLLQ